jgi:hypothetical protein
LSTHSKVKIDDSKLLFQVHKHNPRKLYQKYVDSNQMKTQPSASLKLHPKESPVLDGAIASGSGLDARALSGSDSWRSVLQCLENVDDAFASAHLCLITSTRSLAVGLVLGPLAAYVAAAPTLIAFLNTCEVEGAAVAAVLALRDTQGSVSVGVHVLLEDWASRILSVASQCFPGGRGRRERRRFARAGSSYRGGGRRCLGAVNFLLREDAVGLPIPGLAIETE